MEHPHTFRTRKGASESFEIPYNGEDPLFRVRSSNKIIDTQRIEDTRFFKYPDITTHVFSSINSEFYLVDNRNIPIPIRYSDDMLSWAIEQKVYGKSSQGVYVIRRTVLHNPNNISDLDVYLDYVYRMSEISDEYKIYIRDRIKRANPSSPVVIREVVFILKKLLDEHGAIYDKDNDIVITSGRPSHSLVHPKSRRAEETMREMDLKDKDGELLISLDIVDNDNPFRDYFIQIGNEVYRMRSMPKRTEVNGATFMVRKNGNVIENEVLELSEMHTCGIHHSKEEAIFRSDVSKQLEHKKLALAEMNLEHEVLKQDFTRHKFDKENELTGMKMRNERFKMYLSLVDTGSKINDKLLTTGGDINKRKQDNDIHKAKMRDEEMKHRKLEMDFITTFLKLL